MTSIWLTPIKEIGLLLAWWIWEIPRLILRAVGKTLHSFDDSLQFWANFRLWLALEPLFGDYDWSGRLAGFFIRGVRVLITLFVYVAILVAGLSIVLAWIALPIFALIYILIYVTK